MQELLGDEKFIKYVLCARKGWNPFDEKIQQIPFYYWLLMYHFEEMNEHYEWRNKLEPQADLIGYLANPSFYSEYDKYRKKKVKDNFGETKTSSGSIGHGSADVHFDPTKGMVDEKGNIVVSLEKLQSSNAKGIFVG